MDTEQRRIVDGSGVTVEVEYPAGGSTPSMPSHSGTKAGRHPMRRKIRDEASADLLIAQLNYLHDVLGSYIKLREALGTKATQIKGWAKGRGEPSAEEAALIASLSFVVERATQVWSPAVIWDWLNGRNAFLGGATPLDMLRQGRTTEVLQAVEGEGSGAYA